MEKSSKIYDELFGLREGDAPKKSEEALKIALDTRKFEIELYWKRTAFYWTLIAAAFAGFFLVLSADEVKLPNKYLYSFVVACIGFVFSVAWYLVNRGSKYWQENWENHVDLLSEKIAGPIYRALVSRAEEADVKADGETWARKHWSERMSDWMIGPKAVSVSKINQWVSLFTVLIWFILAVSTVLPRYSAAVLSPAKADVVQLGEADVVAPNETDIVPTVTSDRLPKGYVVILDALVLVVTGAFIVSLFKLTKTHKKTHRHKLVLKESYLVGDIEIRPRRQPDTSGNTPGA